MRFSADAAFSMVDIVFNFGNRIARVYYKDGGGNVIPVVDFTLDFFSISTSFDTGQAGTVTGISTSPPPSAVALTSYVAADGPLLMVVMGPVGDLTPYLFLTTGEFTLNKASIASGETVSLNSFNVTCPFDNAI
jgi:hypothetical protein